MGASSSEASRDNPTHDQRHLIIPLDFNSVQTLPESHVWLDDQSEEASPADPLSIPVIDLTDPDAPRLMIQACETWGIFQLIGHGIPTKLMEDVESEAEKLFSLPTHQKMKVLRSPSGATGYGLPRLSQYFEKRMWHEGFSIIGSPIDHARQLWPHGYQDFCDIMDDYQSQMKALSEQLLRIIFQSLNINSEEINWLKDSGGDGSSIPTTPLQLNSFPACPDPTRAMGLGPHTDTCLITVIKQCKISGLQIFKDGVGWIPVQPIPGALTINVGDFLHILSNGLFTSVCHRVVVNQIPRLSVVFVYIPPGDFIVSPALGPAQIAPRYRAVTAKEFADLKAKHLGKALPFIQI